GQLRPATEAEARDVDRCTVGTHPDRGRVVVPARRTVVGVGPQPRTGRVVRHREVVVRSEEHTSELQSRVDLVCRLLLEKKQYTDFHSPISAFHLGPNFGVLPELATCSECAAITIKKAAANVA